MALVMVFGGAGAALAQPAEDPPCETPGKAGEKNPNCTEDEEAEDEEPEVQPVEGEDEEAEDEEAEGEEAEDEEAEAQDEETQTATVDAEDEDTEGDDTVETESATAGADNSLLAAIAAFFDFFE